MSQDLRNLFKPEQFEDTGDGLLRVPAHTRAQSILNEALDKSVRVYGRNESGYRWSTELVTVTADPDTHQALLVCIEELPNKKLGNVPPLQIVIDPYMPPNEVRFIDEDGNVVGRIENLEIEALPKKECEHAPSSYIFDIEWDAENKRPIAKCVRCGVKLKAKWLAEGE